MSPLQEVLEYMGYNTRSYSGRGMYGKTCLGCVVSHNDLFKLGLEVAQALLDTDENINVFAYKNINLFAYNSPKTDDYGTDIIIYWPNIKYYDEDEEDSTDEES